MNLGLRLLLVCAGFFCLEHVSRAAIIVSYQGSTIAAGGTGFVDVMVSSDALPGSPDLLDSFSGHFQIAPVGGALPAGLQFAGTQNDLQLGQANYVFFGNSLTPPPLGVVSTAVNTNDTYIGGDATLNGLGVLLDNTSPAALLYRFEMSALTASIGDQYTLTLINDGSTSFLDTGFSPLNMAGSSFNAFTITAVPEPATGGILVCGAIAGLWMKRRRTKLAATHS